MKSFILTEVIDDGKCTIISNASLAYGICKQLKNIGIDCCIRDQALIEANIKGEELKSILHRIGYVFECDYPNNKAKYQKNEMA